MGVVVDQNVRGAEVGSKSAICQYRYEDIARATSPDSRLALPLRRRWWNLRRSVWYVSVIGPFEFASRTVPKTRLGKIAFGARKSPVTSKGGGSTSLKAGDWVEVRSSKEIFATLDGQGKLRGLRFTPEMVRFCGRRFRVCKSLNKIIMEATGELRSVKSPTVLLDDVFCDGSAHGGCDRSCFCFWREEWLRKTGSEREEKPLKNFAVVPHSRPAIDQDDVAAVTQVLASCRIAQAEKVKEFEDAVACFVGTKYGVACSSGTSALHLALMSLDVKRGDEVIMPSYVCASPYFATLYVGALPRVVDISLTDLNVCAEKVKQRLSQRTRAIIVPHMFGTPAEIDELVELGVPVIEDCAQSLGAEYRGRRVGSFGHLSVCSFYATKMITTGEGGMVLTDNEEFYSRLQDYRDCDKKALTPVKYNYKMTDFQAALGLSQLKKLPRFVERRRQIASLYTDVFCRCNVSLPHRAPGVKQVFYRYVVLVDGLEQVQKTAESMGVICEKPVWEPIHRSLNQTSCPNSEYAFNHAISVPLYPSLTDQEVQRVIEVLEAIFKEAPEKTIAEITESPKYPYAH
jgi:dTDP-4-amino-4,6-dideoxygalactose transaminase